MCVCVCVCVCNLPAYVTQRSTIAMGGMVPSPQINMLKPYHTHYLRIRLYLKIGSLKCCSN